MTGLAFCGFGPSLFEILFYFKSLSADFLKVVFACIYPYVAIEMLYPMCTRMSEFTKFILTYMGTSLLFAAVCCLQNCAVVANNIADIHISGTMNRIKRITSSRSLG